MRDEPSSSCPLCHQDGSLRHEAVRDCLFGVPGQWGIRTCSNPDCGLVWLDPKPVASDLHEAYATYYTHDEGDAGGDVGGSRGWRRLIVRKLERLWLGVLFLASARTQVEHMFLDDAAPGRLLEVGCGDGRLLARMRRLGWKVAGQDLDAKAAEQARRIHGVTVHVGDLASLALPAESYDAIVMNHVIEHAHDPAALLRECKRLLKPGGLFVATTPNPDSFGHKRFGAAWIGLDPPRHLHLFPLRTLAAIAGSAGFGRSEVWTTPARAGGLLAASADIERWGHHRMRAGVTVIQAVAAAWYQLTAGIAHRLNRKSGEEAVLRAWK